MGIRDAVRALVDGVPKDTTWAVTAGANLLLRGYDVETHDVDVTTDAAGARAIVGAFADHVTEPLAPPGESDADWIRSHYAVLEVAATPVDVVGDAEFREDGRWRPAPPVAEHREHLDLGGLRVPVTSLSYERRQYRARGDDRLALL